MKKIIDGLLYDTEKSELIYEEQEKRRRLFRTDKGRFFKAYINGEIKPITDDEAKEYLGEKDIDKYIEIFGEPEEA